MSTQFVKNTLKLFSLVKILIQPIQFIISIDFIYTQLMSKQFYFKQFGLVQFQCKKLYH